MTEIVTPEEKEAFLNRRRVEESHGGGESDPRSRMDGRKIRMALDLNLG